MNVQITEAWCATECQQHGNVIRFQNGKRLSLTPWRTTQFQSVILTQSAGLEDAVADKDTVCPSSNARGW